MSKDVPVLPRMASVQQDPRLGCDLATDYFVSEGPGSLSYQIRERKMQGPNGLDGAASTRSDTLPLGVTTDHIISLLPSTP